MGWGGDASFSAENPRVRGSIAPLATTKISALPRRDYYLKALEAESVGQKVRPFRKLLGGLAKEGQKAAGKKVRVRAKQPTKRPRISGAH